VVPIKSRAASHFTRTSRRNSVSKNSELRAPLTANREAMHQAESHPPGVDIMDMSQPDFAAYVKTDLEKWRRVAKEGNIVVE